MNRAPHADRSDDVEDATRLIGFGFRQRQLPHRDADYAALVRRFGEEPAFEQLVRRSAAGLGLRVLAVDMRAGSVLAPLPGSVFETRLDQYARQARQSGQREAERVLHGIAHLAIAVLCFPRPEDLGDDGYVGSATVSAVDGLVRHTCVELSERVAHADENGDPTTDAPHLERAWRVYLRRPEAASTEDGRVAPASTEAIVAKALRYLTEQGMLTESKGGEHRVKLYRATSRYQVHVRELAVVEAYQELLRLGVPGQSAHGSPSNTPDSDALY